MQAIENIRTNKTIQESVRQTALALVQGFWTAQIHHYALDLVDSLFAKAMLKTEVIDSIQKSDGISEEVRHEAVSLADNRPDDRLLYYYASKRVVTKPRAGPPAYRRALTQAEHACKLDPGDCFFLTNLGIAQYRLGQYQQALENLSQSEKLYSARFQASHTGNLAFLAMSCHQLGQPEQAREFLSRLRDTMKTRPHSPISEAERFLEEAEELLQGHAPER
jgi:tetratricopeptide (TPR) repeat protein